MSQRHRTSNEAHCIKVLLDPHVYTAPMRRLLVLPALPLALILAACGSNTPSSSATTVPSTSSTTACTPPAVGTPSAASTVSASGVLPAVGNATNLQLEPVISAATAPIPSALATRDLVTGTGTAAVASSTAVIQYVGASYTTGQNFDTSWQHCAAATFPLSGAVPGFAQGIVGMKVGGRREIVIPASLGYGASGNPPAVAPNETIVFVVDLQSVQ